MITKNRWGHKLRITKKVLWNRLESLKNQIGLEDRLESAADLIHKLDEENRKKREDFQGLLNYLNIDYLRDEYGRAVFQPKKKK